MKRKWIAFAVMLPALAAAQAASQTPPAVGAEAEVRAADARRFEAMVRRDRAELERLLAEDLTYIHSTGQIETKAQFLESLASGALVYEAIAPADVQVRLYGDTAVMTGRAVLRVRAQSGRLVLPVRFTSVYVRRDGGWQLAAWQSTRLPEPAR